MRRLAVPIPSITPETKECIGLIETTTVGPAAIAGQPNRRNMAKSGVVRRKAFMGFILYVML
jgi:hypothetical protein